AEIHAGVFFAVEHAGREGIAELVGHAEQRDVGILVHFVTIEPREQRRRGGAVEAVVVIKHLQTHGPDFRRDSRRKSSAAMCILASVRAAATFGLLLIATVAHAEKYEQQ